MTKEKLERAKELEKEIKELDAFIHTTSRCWRGKLEVRKRRWFFSNKAYGAFGVKVLECNTALKDRIQNLVCEYQHELEKELEGL